MTEQKRRGPPLLDIVILLIAGGLAANSYIKGALDWRFWVFVAIAVFSLVSIIRYLRRPR